MSTVRPPIVGPAPTQMPTPSVTVTPEANVEMPEILQGLRLQRPGENPVFATLGIVRGFKPCPLARTVMLLIGPTGSGKSTVIASMGPRTFIFDFDRTYCNIPCSQVSGITPGVIVDPVTGKETICDPWEHWIVTMEWLKTEGRKFYDTVVFDTTDQWVRLMEMGMARLANKRREEMDSNDRREPLQSIVDIGKGGYKTLVDRLVIEGNSLRDAGYGLVYTGHLERRKITVAETGLEMDILCLGLYPSLDKALRRGADFVVKCIRGMEKIVTETPRRHPQTGKSLGIRKETTVVKVVKLIFDEQVVNSETSSMDTVKNRIEMPATIILPENRRHEAWQIIDEAYTAACIVQAEKHLASPAHTQGLPAAPKASAFTGTRPTGPAVARMGSVTAHTEGPF